MSKNMARENVMNRLAPTSEPLEPFRLAQTPQCNGANGQYFVTGRKKLQHHQRRSINQVFLYLKPHPAIPLETFYQSRDSRQTLTLHFVSEMKKMLITCENCSYG